MKRNLFFITLAFIILCGCGYTTAMVMPRPYTQASIHVDNFVNKIDVTRETTDRKVYYAYQPGMESDITREVIDRFIFDGNYEVKDAKSAHYLLKGELIDFKREPLRYDANDNVIEYRMSVVVDIEFYDNDNGKLLWCEKHFAGESTYRTTGQFARSETLARQDAVKDLARRIVERTVENW